jgi:uncharacterized membrane protein YqjE
VFGSRIRAALAEHVAAYGEVMSAAVRLWSEQLVRRALGFAVAAAFALFALFIIVLVAIAAAWPTPWRWWVVGGILLLLAIGVVWGLVMAQQALRDKPAPPWGVLAEELAADLRGESSQDEPESAPEFDPYNVESHDER